MKLLEFKGKILKNGLFGLCIVRWVPYHAQIACLDQGGLFNHERDLSLLLLELLGFVLLGLDQYLVYSLVEDCDGIQRFNGVVRVKHAEVEDVAQKSNGTENLSKFQGFGIGENENGG